MVSLTSHSEHTSRAQLSRTELEQLYVRKPYINDLNDFLSEQDHVRALSYWLQEYHQIEKLDDADDIRLAIHQSIADIDHQINDLINVIIHQPKFQKLEASWRGLWYLAEQAEGCKNVKIKVLNISWLEVSKDIDRALDFDQSSLFQKVYSEEYGTPGGEPYAVLVGDYTISHKSSKNHPYDDVATLEGLAQISAAAFSPFIASASHELFGLDHFGELGQPLNLKAIFKQKEYIKWNALRERTDSRFIGLTLPSTLGRLPYRKTEGSYKGVFFNEKPQHNSLKGQLWSNSCYAFAGILIREFDNVGWFGHIRGVPRDQIGGGLLTNSFTDSFPTDKEGLISKPITEVVITDTVEKDISELGFIPLCQCFDVPFAAFFNNQSIQKPKKDSNKNTQINARLSAMLQHVMCGSRIAHYIKVMIRDKIGSFLSASECESFLRKWLFNYTTGREDLNWEEQARFPLRRAAVNVREHPEKPGQYICVIHIVPHYQVDQMVSELELVTELAQSK